jgi:hypothetical protein
MVPSIVVAAEARIGKLHENVVISPVVEHAQIFPVSGSVEVAVPGMIVDVYRGAGNRRRELVMAVLRVIVDGPPRRYRLLDAQRHKQRRLSFQV